jgi:hypothetical protein
MAKTVPQPFKKKNIGNAKPQLDTYNIIDNPEWQLAQSLVCEFTDATGIKITYFQKNENQVGQYDPLYGETQDASYKDGKETKILYEVGEINTIYSMFGMMNTDQLVAHIPQSIFLRDVSKTEWPKPGDLLQVEWYMGDFAQDGVPDRRNFTITHVAQDQSIFQLRSLVFVLYLAPFTFSEESQSARDISIELSGDDFDTISDFGDNEFIDTASKELSAYDGISTKIYGF